MKIQGAEQVLLMQIMMQTMQKQMGDSPAFAVMLESMSKALENSDMDLSSLLGNDDGAKVYSEGGQSILQELKNEVKNEIGSLEGINGGTKDIDSIINRAAKKYGVDPKLIKAVIKQESDFNPNVTSWAGAQGLMQIMPSEAKELGIRNPYDPAQNIDGGTKYLRKLLDMFGNQKELALAAYNGGSTRMMNRNVKSVKDIERMPYETRDYVKKVMKYYKG